MSDQPTARPSVKDLAKLNMPVVMMPGQGPPRGMITPRTSVSGSFAPPTLQPSSSTSGSFQRVPSNTTSTSNTPTNTTTGNQPTVTGQPLVSPRIAMAAGMNFGGFGAPRPSISRTPSQQQDSTPQSSHGPSIILPHGGQSKTTELSQEDIENRQQNIGETTRRRPSVRRASRLSRTHFDEIDVDVSGYIQTLNAPTPTASSTPTSLKTFQEEGGDKDKKIDVLNESEMSWEVVDTHAVAADMEKDENVNIVAKLIVNKSIQYVISQIENDETKTVEATITIVEEHFNTTNTTTPATETTTTPATETTTTTESTTTETTETTTTEVPAETPTETTTTTEAPTETTIESTEVTETKTE